jgi:diacylglycerol kinase
MSRKNSTAASFGHAFDGLAEAINNEPNFRTHVLIALLATCLGIVLGLTKTEWLILALTIILVLIMELFNTAMEAIVDLVSPQIHPKAKVAKDVSAAAVLLSAIFSLIVGVYLFLPKIILLLQ